MASRFSEHKARPRRRVIELSCAPRHTVAVWFSELVAKAPKASLREVLVHLVGTLLRSRGAPIKANSKQTGRHPEMQGCGDFNFSRISYHVAAVPTSVQLQKCKKDLAARRFPVLLVLGPGVRGASQLAERARIGRGLTILALESFVCHALLFQSLEQRRTMFNIWVSIIADYNHRIESTFVPAIHLA